MELVLLVHLRYLAMKSKMEFIPSAITNLSRLETFLVENCSTNVGLPSAICNIMTLTHLCITNSQHGFSVPLDNLEGIPDLEYLDTLALAIDPPSQSLQKVLTKLPSIRRLKCIGVGSEEYTGDRKGILVLDYLSRLESLKVSKFVGHLFDSPLNLKKLTLSHNHQRWREIFIIGMLPNLEVLKLCSESFVGEKWEMEEGIFPNLRFLKSSSLDIRRWTGSSDNFSPLEKLVLINCDKLETVPSCPGECPTLEMIMVIWCSKSAASSVKKI